MAEPDELEAIRQLKGKTPGIKDEVLAELWRIVVVAVNVGLRESKILAIERSWIRKREDGYWLALPPATSRLKGTPPEVPLNRVALAALHEQVSSLADGRVFRRWNHVRAFKKYWDVTSERAKLQDLHFHDLRHTFATRLQRVGVDYEVRQALLGHRMPSVTAQYSHGGPEWNQKLRQAVTALEKAYPLSYGLSYEKATEAVGDSNLLNFGEPPGTRTQGPRLKRAMLYRLS